jgi:hypothetical protein
MVDRSLDILQHKNKNFYYAIKYRAIKNKKIEMAMVNTLQLAARKNLIQMSSDVIKYNSDCHSGFSRHLPEKQRVQKEAWHNS